MIIVAMGGWLWLLGWGALLLVEWVAKVTA